VGFLLTVITAYIYFAWWRVNQWRFEYNNLEFSEIGGGNMPAMPGQGPMQQFQPQPGGYPGGPPGGGYPGGPPMGMQ
jgi:hypothetical protein